MASARFRWVVVVAAFAVAAAACTSDEGGPSATGGGTNAEPDTFTYSVNSRGHDRVGPGDRLLERGHRPPQHLRDAHALQRRDPGGRSAPGRLVGVVEGRPDVDLHAPPGRDVPHGQPADRGGREGLDRADDGDRRGRGLHLGRGEEDRRARRHDPRVPPVVPVAARPRRRRARTRPTSTTRRRAAGRTSATGSPTATTPAPARTWSPSTTPATRSSSASRPIPTTGAGGTTPTTTSATSSASRPRRTPPPSCCARARSRWSSG